MKLADIVTAPSRVAAYIYQNPKKSFGLARHYIMDCGQELKVLPAMVMAAKPAVSGLNYIFSIHSLLESIKKMVRCEGNSRSYAAMLCSLVALALEAVAIAACLLAVVLVDFAGLASGIGIGLTAASIMLGLGAHLIRCEGRKEKIVSLSSGFFLIKSSLEMASMIVSWHIKPYILAVKTLNHLVEWIKEIFKQGSLSGSARENLIKTA